MTDQQLRLELLKLAHARKASAEAVGKVTDWQCIELADKWYEWAKKPAVGVCGGIPEKSADTSKLTADE